MNGFRIWVPTLLVSLLTACGGGGGSETTTPVSQTLTVSTAAGTGGAISPVSATVSSGQTTSFSVVANDGFQLQQVAGCAGTLNGTTYTTGSIQQNCTVTASFAAKTYQVSVNANTGGKVEPLTASVTHGTQATVTITPDAGYVIGHVDGCGGTLSGNIYTTEKLVGSCQIKVSFVVPKWLVSTNTNEHEYEFGAGSVRPKEALVSHQGSATFELVPQAGFSIKKVEGCAGKLIHQAPKATFISDPIQKACTLYAHFTRRPVANGKVIPRVKLGNALRLNATTSYDPEGELLTYKWSLLKAPTGSQAKLEYAEQAIAEFVPDLAGHYQFTLVVNDGSGDSQSVIFDSHATAENTAPIHQLAYTEFNSLGSKISFDASESYDVDGDEIAFSWTLTNKNGQTILTANSSNTLEWTPEETGAYMMTLKLTDNHGNMALDFFRVQVDEPRTVVNQPPSAKIQFVPEKSTGDTVLLNASYSIGEAGETLTYQWVLVTKPEQSKVSLQNAQSATSSFSPDAEGTYVFKVTVSDGSLTDDESIGVQVRDTSIRLVRESLNSEEGLIELLLPYRDFPYKRDLDEANKTIDFGKYYLVTKGKDYVIENVTATEEGNDTRAYFYGLHEGLVIPAGTVLEFNPKATLVRGVELEFQYKFRIKDTNKTFLLESYFKLPN